jgi:myo-inositol-1(or 4)-monophosphatase
MKSPLKVSNTQNTKDYFCTLIRPTCENEYLKLSKLFFYVKTTRVVVSAALELAYVASGKTDCFVDIVFNKNLNKGGVRLVDVAAGILIVKESGGTIWSDNLNYLIENKNNLKLQTNLIAINDIRNLDELLALYSFE